eukprot:Skav216570  [mRNA]  locus=scaffold3598:10130:11885:- [translate_table: standard]
MTSWVMFDEVAILPLAGGHSGSRGGMEGLQVLLRSHPDLRHPDGCLHRVPGVVNGHAVLIQQLMLHGRLVTTIVIFSRSLQDIRVPPSD